MGGKKHALRKYVSTRISQFMLVPIVAERQVLTCHSIDEIKDLVGHSSDVSTLNAQEFDPQGQYKDVLRAVEEAGDGKARIFRLDHGRTRAEYYLISLDTRGQKIVGFKAKAVES